ncbi:HNH endonuclease [Clostridium estertheticum]|uniref:HNH endonuclease n=1 Tax=Clostridium estertheticum TaxID=238834 RepID=UPI001CF4B87A|nr:HNH endonuclease [Clostridium estertheticum]MCB2361595.1 HNH endonuclease [Clostridium estertheticum]
MEKKTMKYFTKSELIKANKAAIRENRRCQLNEELLKNLPENRTFPIAYEFYHTKNEMRVGILFDLKGTFGYLDMSMNRYKVIPTATYDDEGIEYEDPKITELKQPYPNEREWEEKTVIKPVRKQGKFRREVLKSYENQCAVCNINRPSLLRAAHIIPVVKDNDDSVNNGICLCVLHEVAFDNGILKISPDGEVIVVGDGSIKTDFTHMKFPKDKNNYPSHEKLKQRFEMVYSKK